MTVYTGGCHCGRIRFEVEGELARVSVCSCSICSRTAYLHWTVDPAALRLLTPPGSWSSYRFLTGTSENRFCPTCGVSPFRVPRSDPDKLTVNARCLDGVDAEALPVDRFDGREWEASMAAERGWSVQPGLRGSPGQR